MLTPCIQLLDIVQPGCDGVITNYKSIPRDLLEPAYTFLMTLNPEVVHDTEEFGGQGMDYESDELTEGGGHSYYYHRDEL